MAKSNTFIKPADEIKVDITLGHVGRHCILHALNVIEAAISQAGTNMLDDFVMELTSIVTVPKAANGKKKKSNEFKPLPPPPIVTSFEINKFYENVLSPAEFTKLLEEQLKCAALEVSIDLDVNKLQEICWKYYSKEKGKAVCHPDWLSPTCTYRLFLIFNHLLDEAMTTTISGKKLSFFLEKVATCSGFLGPVVSEVVKNDKRFGVTFPEFIEEVTNCFDYLKLETCLTCEIIHDFVDELINGVLKKGYLVKEGHVRHSWKKRYFILQENIMTYYVSRETMKSKGAMVLNGNTKVFGIPDEKSKPLYRFVVTCGAKGKVFVMSATDQRDKSEWLCAVKEAIAIGKLKNRSDAEKKSSTGGDMCEMSAHYKVKYGLEGLESTLRQATKRFSRSIDHDVKLGTSLPNVFEADDGKDSDSGSAKDDEGDDDPYLTMTPANAHATITHSMSMDKVKMEQKLSLPVHLSSSLSAVRRLSSESSSQSVPTTNGLMNSSGRLDSQNSTQYRFSMVYENETNNENDDEDDNYYILGPDDPVTSAIVKKKLVDKANSIESATRPDQQDSDEEYDYLKLIPDTPDDNLSDQK